MSLQNAQAEFAEILFNDEEHADFLQPAQNMRIYRNNVQSTLGQTLLDIYPMINRLVGEDFFRITAKEYILKYPSRSSNLHDYGEYFSSFLAEYPPLHNLTYLAEVAEFEWTCHQLYFAADHGMMDIQKLESLSPDQYGHLHFTLHPACKLMKFHYPLLRILALCKGELSGTINVNEGGVNLLIARPEWDILLIPVSSAEFAFLAALQENYSITDALESALQLDPEFKMDEKLPEWVRHKIIVDFFSIHE
ncbi:hypothetical protein AQUSIP_26060 [Aquicella siphonis]|uniref:Putative DNA-binding domain-containing protein n=1 Tax=Aquicella siphonis TaxID=254247 RepID=A0A5E4PJL8_9COXI|nr:DNA-binding domain-containing protein [Aquicella siphonis]VVC77279.1 hypothetical protein AQUSIP_26060 [Aquicella siphonis]